MIRLERIRLTNPDQTTKFYREEMGYSNRELRIIQGYIDQLDVCVNIRSGDYQASLDALPTTKVTTSRKLSNLSILYTTVGDAGSDSQQTITFTFDSVLFWCYIPKVSACLIHFEHEGNVDVCKGK